MTAKEYLWQYQDILRDIRTLKIKAEQVERLATNAGVSTQFVTTPEGEAVMDRVQTSGISDKVGEIASAVADMQVCILRKNAQAANKLKEITATIDMVEDAVQRELLYRRYIGGEKLSQISSSMYCSIRHCTRLNSSGIRAVQRILDERCPVLSK